MARWVRAGSRKGLCVFGSCWFGVRDEDSHKSLPNFSFYFPTQLRSVYFILKYVRSVGTLGIGGPSLP